LEDLAREKREFDTDFPEDDAGADEMCFDRFGML
jgi:hypothetical protein